MEGGSRKKEEAAPPAPRGFRKLVAWQKAQALASLVFTTVGSGRSPHWLSDQVMRAALSVPANIAEGYTRGGLADYLRFLDIARSSLAELESHLYFMAANGLIRSSEQRKLDEAVSDAGNLLVGLIRALRAKQNDGSWNRLREERAGYETMSGEEEYLPPSSFLLPGGEG
jgi:four helix bundle protein